MDLRSIQNTIQNEFFMAKLKTMENKMRKYNIYRGLERD